MGWISILAVSQRWQSNRFGHQLGRRGWPGGGDSKVSCLPEVGATVHCAVNCDTLDPIVQRRESRDGPQHRFPTAERLLARNRIPPQLRGSHVSSRYRGALSVPSLMRNLGLYKSTSGARSWLNIPSCKLAGGRVLQGLNWRVTKCECHFVGLHAATDTRYG